MIKLVVDYGRFRPLNMGFKDCRDNFLGFFTFIFGAYDVAFEIGFWILFTGFVDIDFWTFVSFFGFCSFVPRYFSN